MSLANLKQNWRMFTTYPIVAQSTYASGLTSTTTTTSYDKSHAQIHRLDASWPWVFFNPLILFGLFPIQVPHIIGIIASFVIGLIVVGGLGCDERVFMWCILSLYSVYTYLIGLDFTLDNLVEEQGKRERPQFAALVTYRSFLDLLFSKHFPLRGPAEQA
jgi:hypothetical protein